jgi:hypothetical protein
VYTPSVEVSKKGFITNVDSTVDEGEDRRGRIRMKRERVPHESLYVDEQVLALSSSPPSCGNCSLIDRGYVYPSLHRTWIHTA